MIASVVRSRVSAELRRELLTVIDLGSGADLIGPLPLPEYLLPVFDYCTRQTGVSASLLAAVAGTLTRFNPAFLQGARAGIMSLPVSGDVSPHVADWNDLESGSAERKQRAISAIRLNIVTAAGKLHELRRRMNGGLADALYTYVLADQAGTEQNAKRAKEIAGQIAGNFAFYAMRAIEPEQFKKIRGLFE